jgi:hypothetical protein
MEPYRLEITIAPDCEIVAETREIHGEKCLDSVELIQKLVRAKIMNSYLTDDYYLRETSATSNKGTLEAGA